MDIRFLQKNSINRTKATINSSFVIPNRNTFVYYSQSINSKHASSTSFAYA
ncbi:hypothetical protein [Helicoverpa armigera NPV NNg1]|uniref:Uncharacterized protein n=2 Tax=Helicoverpa armigera nucleopolyhedrovirus TaxID=51313 RepID=B5X021_9ABAC|nr:hypothetical protein [Helicoverpa armigera nucleopolyhedrovirus]BAG74591.1 hypothetical protein [Helicoverpa armigera NPV NNg1]